MAYPTEVIPMTLCDLQGHSSTGRLSEMWFFVQLCSSWQYFNWHTRRAVPLR